MKVSRYKTLFFLITIVGLLFSCSNVKNELPNKNEVIDLIEKVNNNWQEKNPEHKRSFWDNAAYHTGNIEAYKVTGIENYLKYSEDWAIHNQWKGAKSDDKENWMYSYGESDEYVLFGDWQICFQTYIDLFNLSGGTDSIKVARALEVMSYQMSTENDDYWWWADGLYMVMPVMTRLYNLTGDKLYLDKLYEYFTFAQSIMYDEETGLFFRDAKYVYPEHKTSNSLKDFWARGNGWVFAGLARILKDLPADYEHKNEFETIFIGMAETLKLHQQPEGYWTRSLFDPAHAPGPETSGTAFFTFAYLWGINNNLLDSQTYMPVVFKSWDYLTNTAIDENGNVGYVQPIGERAIPGQVVDENSTSNFGVGAVLLAASEMYRVVNIENED